MSFETETEIEDDAAPDDLGDALCDADPTFVTEEPKKQLSRGTLVIAIILAACGAATYFMYVRNGPSKAGAAAVEAAQADTTIQTFLSADNVKAMKDMLSNTHKVVQQFLASPGKSQVPIDELHTNPFRLSSAKVKATDEDAVSRQRREEERATVLKAAQTLQLQSIIHSGSRKACLINNTMYTEGQKADAFTIESIGPASVVVRNGQYRFELKMQK